jgi:serine/threonine-protein kinase HipA
MVNELELVCTRVYSNLSAKMAMKIGSKYDANNLLQRHWEQLCQDIHYRYLAMNDIIQKQSELILKAAEIEKKALISSGQNHLIIDNIMRVIETNITNTLKGFK